MSDGEQSKADRLAELLALAGELRPELHRYCSRLVGSVIEGEDVVHPHSFFSRKRKPPTETADLTDATRKAN